MTSRNRCAGRVAEPRRSARACDRPRADRLPADPRAELLAELREPAEGGEVRGRVVRRAATAGGSAAAAPRPRPATCPTRTPAPPARPQQATTCGRRGGGPGGAAARAAARRSGRSARSRWTGQFGSRRHKRRSWWPASRGVPRTSSNSMSTAAPATLPRQRVTSTRSRRPRVAGRGSTASCTSAQVGRPRRRSGRNRTPTDAAFLRGELQPAGVVRRQPVPPQPDRDRGRGCAAPGPPAHKASASSAVRTTTSRPRGTPHAAKAGG